MFPVRFAGTWGRFEMESQGTRMVSIIKRKCSGLGRAFLLEQIYGTGFGRQVAEMNELCFTVVRTVIYRYICGTSKSYLMMDLFFHVDMKLEFFVFASPFHGLDPFTLSYSIPAQIDL